MHVLLLSSTVHPASTTPAVTHLETGQILIPFSRLFLQLLKAPTFFINHKQIKWTLHLESISMKSIFEFENLSMSIQTTQEIGDDFSTVFSSFYLKIFTGLLFFGVIFYNTILSLLLIQFEKFGNDPMKRSVTNLITSQIHYIALLSNMFFVPFLTWRVIIGPIQPDLTGTFYFCLIVTQSRSPL